MSTSFVDENIVKVSYDNPLDVAKLFGRYRLAYTLNHIFATFIDEVNDARKSKICYLEPVVYNKTHNVFLIEYSFLIDVLSQLVEDKKMFLFDYNSSNDDKKNPIFLITNLLEDYLGLVKINNKKMNCSGKKEIIYRPSYCIQTVISYFNTDEQSDGFVQMDSITFSAFEVYKILNKDIFDALMESFRESSFEQVRNIYGRKACEKFWIEQKLGSFAYKSQKNPI